MPLLRAVAGRFVAGAGVLVAVLVLVFGLLAVQPGDVAARSDDSRVPAAARAAMREQFGLDRPWPTRLGALLRGAVTGDLGYSVARAQPVREAIGRALGPSLVLGISGLALGLVGGVLLGTWQGHHAGGAGDRWSSRVALVIVAIPDFWLALLVLTVGAKMTGLFPVGGWPRSAALGDALRHLTLPALTLALLVTSRVSRYHRASVATARGSTWARAARSRGVPERRIRWRHVARSAAASTIALTSLLVPMVIAGTVFVEVVFAWPGIGRLLLDAVQARDVPLTIGATLTTAVFAVFGSALADLAQAWLDPRTAAR